MAQTDQRTLRPHFLGTDGPRVVFFMPGMVDDFEQLTGFIDSVKKHFVEQGLQVGKVTSQPAHSNQQRMQRIALTVGLDLVGGANLLRTQVETLPAELHGRFASRCIVRLNEVFGPDGQHRYTEAFLDIVDQGGPRGCVEAIEAIEEREGVLIETTEEDPAQRSSLIRCQLFPRTPGERYGGTNYQPHEVIGRVAEDLGIYIDGRISPHQQQITELSNAR